METLDPASLGFAQCAMEELQASFESFFKASMGMSAGPVLMPDGSTVPAHMVPSMAPPHNTPYSSSVGRRPHLSFTYT